MSGVRVSEGGASEGGASEAGASEWGASELGTCGPSSRLSMCYCTRRARRDAPTSVECRVSTVECSAQVKDTGSVGVSISKVLRISRVSRDSRRICAPFIVPRRDCAKAWTENGYCTAKPYSAQ